jgi:predicted nuclease of predicted toxin-antitoxin system
VARHTRFGIIAKSTIETGLFDAEDETIFMAARRLGCRAIMTKDKDLVDLAARHGPPPKIIWVRLGNMRFVPLLAALTRSFGDVLAELAGGAACVEITDTGVSRVS